MDLRACFPCVFVWPVFVVRPPLPLACFAGTTVMLRYLFTELLAPLKELASALELPSRTRVEREHYQAPMLDNLFVW